MLRDEWWCEVNVKWASTMWPYARQLLLDVKVKEVDDREIMSSGFVIRAVKEILKRH